MHIKYAEEDADPLPRAVGSAIATVSVTSPSPGETIKPSPAGMARRGSRKNHRKNAASSTGAMPHAQLPVSPSQHHRHRQQAQTVDVTVTNHGPERLYGYRATAMTRGAHVGGSLGSVQSGRTTRAQNLGDRRSGTTAWQIAGKSQPPSSFKPPPAPGVRAQRSGLWRAASASSGELPQAVHPR